MRDVLLDEFITQAAQRPFEWGKFDCALFVSDWCVKCAGFDPALNYRGKYKTEIGAKRQLLKKDKSMSNACDDHMLRVGVNFAQKGDICAALLDGSMTMGIIASRGGIWFKTENSGVDLLHIKPSIVWRVL
ncbi:MAG: hypothetical protein COA45_03980 [Zetaproteobacteria bacterium]|nr:MAG: hypothetical protein COA45_03980 [Zetaproteobacteria bacterium]